MQIVTPGNHKRRGEFIEEMRPGNTIHSCCSVIRGKYERRNEWYPLFPD